MATARARTSLPVLVDDKARVVSYLRISLTDRCNYRCLYCMPEEGVALSPKNEVLSFEEIARVVRLFQHFGVRRVRLTGGEPTVRRDLVELVARLAALELEDLSMTTNGERLVELADPLRRAGLTRLNVSLDSLDAARFLAITRRGDLSRVLAGIDAARAAGFMNTKLNIVAMKGGNDEELVALCEYAWRHDLVPRFIEFMPMSDGALFIPSGAFLPAAEIRARLANAFGALVDDDGDAIRGVGPARYERVADGAFAGRRVGIISAVSEPFCETCNRVRLSATGKLHTCLALEDDADLRVPMRAGVSDDELLEILRAAVAGKKDGHCFTPSGQGAAHKHMVSIGG